MTEAEYTASGEECPEELAANTDEFTTVQDTTLSGNVLDNDAVPEGATVTVTGPKAGPWHGDLVLNADGTFTYTPAANWVGTDSFRHTITDQDGNTAVGTVNLTITEDDAGIPLVAPGAGRRSPGSRGPRSPSARGAPDRLTPRASERPRCVRTKARHEC